MTVDEPIVPKMDPRSWAVVRWSGPYGVVMAEHVVEGAALMQLRRIHVAVEAPGVWHTVEQGGHAVWTTQGGSIQRAV